MPIFWGFKNENLNSDGDQELGCMPIFWGFKNENLHSVGDILGWR